MQKSGLHEVPQNRNLKNIMVFSALASRKQHRISLHLNGSNLTVGHSTITCYRNNSRVAMYQTGNLQQNVETLDKNP